MRNSFILSLFILVVSSIVAFFMMADSSVSVNNKGKCMDQCSMRPTSSLDNVYMEMMDNMRRFQTEFDRMYNMHFNSMLTPMEDPWMMHRQRMMGRPNMMTLGDMSMPSSAMSSSMAMAPMGGVRTWASSPKMDIQETSDKLIVHGDVPGMSKDAVKVTVENGMLTVRGEMNDAKVEEKNDENSRYYLKERSSSSFSRSFALPDNVMEDDIKAKIENGVLEIIIPKDVKAIKHHPKTIAIE